MIVYCLVMSALELQLNRDWALRLGAFALPLLWLVVRGKAE